ncbi:hypothetical protein [Lacticaseibacillus sp. 866-1]|uniref:hypothetical protein n=1 Tax=Lacticaseibacillus sp. 866-1 TaxID=2799576 RepID=UPI001943E013|nr:hypothetical protein [Lacticaseibacillus sp. 866-1]
MKRPVALLITISVALAAGIGLVVHHQLSQTDAAARSVQRVTEATQALHKPAFIADPKSNLASAYLNQANYAYQQAERHHTALSAHQKVILRAAAQQLKDAKLYVAIRSEASAVLGPTQVITDQKYDSTTLERAFRTLEAANIKYAAAAKTPVTLVSLQTAALAKLRAAQRRPATAQTVAAAEAAIAEVPVAAFKQTYTPIAESLKQEEKVAPNPPDANAAEPQVPEQAAPAAPAKQAENGQTTKAAPAAKGSAQPAKTPAEEQPPKAPTRPEADSASSQQQAPDASVSDADRALIGIGGLFDTMHEAETAMKAAQAAAGSNRQASAYSIQFSDGSIHYTWSWLESDPIPAP